MFSNYTCYGIYLETCVNINAIINMLMHAHVHMYTFPHKHSHIETHMAYYVVGCQSTFQNLSPPPS